MSKHDASGAIHDDPPEVNLRLKVKRLNRTVDQLLEERDAAREKVAQLKAALRLAQRQISSGVGLDPARKVVLDAIQEALSG